MKISLLMSGVILAGCNSSETTKLTKVDIVDAVFASGQIISEKEYLVTANTEGFLINSSVEEGNKIQAGAALFELSNDVQSENLSIAQENYQDAINKLDENAPERLQIQMQVDQAKSQLELDKKNFERYEKLLENKAVSQLDFDKAKLQYENAMSNYKIQEKKLEDLVNTLEVSAKNARSQLVIQEENNSEFYLVSAIDGEVLKVFKQEGELVRKGEALAKIGSGSKRIRLFVAEEDIAQMALRQEVLVSLNTDKERVYSATIVKIYPSFDDAEQSFIVEASFQKVPTSAYHNTQLQANIIIDQKENANVIPSRYLVNGDSVILEGGDVKGVKVGIRSTNWVEVLAGIDQQDVIVKPQNP